jgi:hypothetical protein
MRMVTGEDSVEGVGGLRGQYRGDRAEPREWRPTCTGGDRRSAGMRLHKVDRNTPGTRETFKTIVNGKADEELVGQVAQGDDRALSELYDRYSRAVYATGIRLLRDAQLAEELVQDAFTNVWRGAKSFESERASFSTWLYRIARNRAVDLDRRRRVRPLSVGEAQLRVRSPAAQSPRQAWTAGMWPGRSPASRRSIGRC